LLFAPSIHGRFGTALGTIFFDALRDFLAMRVGIHSMSENAVATAIFMGPAVCLDPNVAGKPPRLPSMSWFALHYAGLGKF
jgi:hypothetical protein